jgi:arylsulfatase A-like enzyme
MEYKSLLKTVLPALTIASCNNAERDVKTLADIDYGYKPHILWLSVEDISCDLACYGDSTASTPNIDRLAAEGVVFDNAFATVGVCSPSRSSIITGMYSTYLGTANHRTYGVQIPEQAKTFPQYLRETGYFTTNNPKEDYNFETPPETWDESGFAALHQHRQDKSKPLFSVYNFLVTHESQIWGHEWEQLTIEMDSVRVPKYYPKDNKIIKKDIARKYANIELLDLYIGQKMRQLEEEGRLDSTIVVFWSDHGGMMPRQKREAYNSGLKVPLIMRFPNKELAGTRVDELVSLIDLGPTMMTLAGLEKPQQMHGKVIAGKQKETPREYIHGARNRSDAGYDMSRSVFDGRYRYMRNYYPEIRVYKYGWYDSKMSTTRELYRLFRLDSLTGHAALWFEDSKPVEELYDTREDYDEVNNLAGNPEYAEKLKELRHAVIDWQNELPDVCTLPEDEIFSIQEKYKMPVANFFDNNPGYYVKCIEIMNKSLFPKDNEEDLLKALNDTIPTVRYWAVRGIGRLGSEGKEYYPLLSELMNDPSPSVKVALAWAMNQIGHKNEATKLYKEVLLSDNTYAKSLALNYLVDDVSVAKNLKDIVYELNESWESYYDGYLIYQSAENLVREMEDGAGYNN